MDHHPPFVPLDDQTLRRTQTRTRPEICTSERKYLFLYPMVKQRRWYGLPPEERGRIMKSHIEVGRRYPEITINTTYSYGIDDQEFVVCFEGDDPGEFLDLVNELRPTESSEYTERETPIFTCVAISVAQGARRPRRTPQRGRRRRPGARLTIVFPILSRSHEQDRNRREPPPRRHRRRRPPGFYAAEHILKDGDLHAQVDLFDRLPTPFGLVRGGVAPTIRRSSR